MKLDHCHRASCKQIIDALKAERDDYKQALYELGVTPEEARNGAARSREMREDNKRLAAECAKYKSSYELAAMTADEARKNVAVLCAENAYLKRQLANEKARDIHSCHADCTRNGCVNRRLREAIQNFLFEWDNSGSSGAWPVRALAHLREVMK
jgi:uncharacterized protein YdiU (UPF0061 family)